MHWTAKIERTLGGLKFAVVSLTCFSLLMIVGTLCESYFGTDFANRAIYTSPLFRGAQAAMILCIALAALLRWPPKKRLYGFYTVHAGLVIIGAGSFLTSYAGIDGNIHLPPQTPARDIILDRDIFTIEDLEKGETASYPLPYKAFPTTLNRHYKGVTLLRYLPFAERKFFWKPSTSPLWTSGSYLIANSGTQRSFTLTLHPKATDFSNTLQLGPLAIHYLPSILAECLQKQHPAKVIVWDHPHRRCFTPEEKNLPLQKTKKGHRFFVVPHSERPYSFFPDLSPWPITKEGRLNTVSPLRVFNKKMFEKDPHLLLFGHKAAFYDKKKQGWNILPLQHPIKLPWMNFDLTLLHHTTDIPSFRPVSTTPIQKNNELIRGGEAALYVRIDKEEYGIIRGRPHQVVAEGRPLTLHLEKDSLQTPFELVLTKFKMDKNPGTNTPASYESFVQLFTKEGPKQAHISMNRPLTYKGLTFYQASYSVDDRGNHSSTLSANYDPGRPWKYFGCLMLIAGAIWHYTLNAQKLPKSAL